MIDQLNELFDEQNRLNEDLKRQDQEYKDVVDSSTRKLVFLDKPINTWTIDMVGTWLDSIEFHHYKEIFRKQMVDGETLLDLDEDTIKTLVKEYHKKKCYVQLIVYGYNNKLIKPFERRLKIKKV